MSNVLRRMPIFSDIVALARTLVRHKAAVMECPCCGKSNRFGLAGMPPRLNAKCPECGSRERHRQLRLYLSRHPELVSGTILHFAPERSLRSYLAAGASEYVGCDYNPKKDEIRINIEEIAFSDDKFDLIVCSHVLEHVDDAKALRELYRVLKPSGTLLLMFPVTEGWEQTFEDAKFDTPDLRLRYFGQEDHVRRFGADCRLRIRAAGFVVVEDTAHEPDVSRYGLTRAGKIFICTKPRD